MLTVCTHDNNYYKWFSNMGKLSGPRSLFPSWTVNSQSVSKSVFSHRNKDDWCENYGDNFSHFCRSPLESEEEEEEEEEET